MVSHIVTDNINELKQAPQTFESIYTIIKNHFTSEVFGEWLENGEVCRLSYYELYEKVDAFSKDSDSRWVLSGDSSVTSLDGDLSGLDLNGHQLYINGVLYGE